MKKIILALLCAFLLLCLFGCTGSRISTKERWTAEKQQKEAATESKLTEKRETATTETNTGSKEKRNVVIEFTEVDYYPEEGKYPNRFTELFQKADSTFEATGKDKDKIKEESERSLKDKSKPPNIKSMITGRIVISDDKQEAAETKATANKDETTTETTTTTAEEATKVAAQTKEKTYPKNNPFLWVLVGCGLAAVLAGGFYVRKKIVRR